MSYSHSILYLHLFLAELEVDYCVCVQAYHQIDEVVRQAVAAQHFEECRSRNGIKCLNQIDKRDISLKVMLLSLSQCHEELESTIDGPSLWTKSTLILWSVLLHDFFQPLYHHARQDFGRNIQKTYAAPVLRLSKVSLFGQKNQLDTLSISVYYPGHGNKSENAKIRNTAIDNALSLRE